MRKTIPNLKYSIPHVFLMLKGKSTQTSKTQLLQHLVLEDVFAWVILFLYRYDVGWTLALVQPGRHVALASLWIAVASILACYTIEPELDENGKPMDSKAEWYSGPTVVNRILPFKCRFVPRSKDVEASLGMNLTWGPRLESVELVWVYLYFLMIWLIACCTWSLNRYDT